MQTIPPSNKARAPIESGNWMSPWLRCFTAGVLLAVYPNLVLAQTATPLAQGQTAQNQPAPAQSAAAQSASTSQDKPGASAPVQNAKLPQASDRRRAAKLYLAASKLLVAEKFEEALRGYEQAVRLDPSNPDYPLAEEVARNHAVTALIQAAAKDRLMGDPAASRAALAHAFELNPHSAQVTEHLYQLGDEALNSQSRPLYEQVAGTAGEDAAVLSPAAGTHSFHLHADQRQTIQQVFKAYGIETTLDESVRATQLRFDVDDASFAQAIQLLELTTKSFYAPLDAHRALVASDTQDNRQRFIRQELETVYLPGLTPAELTEVGKLAKDLFDIQQSGVASTAGTAAASTAGPAPAATAGPAAGAATGPAAASTGATATAGTITLRAPASALNAFNAAMSQLLDGRNQVLLDVRMIQVAHTSERNTGVQLPQTVSAFNVYSEEQSILNTNQALVQQIISSGLAAPGDTLAILGILLASGQVSSSLFSNGIALFGGGLTQSALAPGAITANLNLNSSDSRQLDNLQLRLGDGEEGQLRLGERYPIQTSSFSNLAASSTSIPGLNAAGASGSLSSLLSSLTGGASTIPMIQYEDLGLTLKATPRVMRGGDVALTLELKLDALSGSNINSMPILNNQAYSGVVTLKQGEGVVVVSNLDKSQSRAISGTPGISEIPGLSSLTGNDTQKSDSSLLIVITPHVIRATQAAGHTPMIRVEKSNPAR
jgi:type II secretory pathway component GspD/PulD (secretin)